MAMAQVLKVETQMTRIRASKIAIKPIGGKGVTYDLRADIREASRNGTTAKLRYQLVVETFPMILRVEMDGVVYMDVGFLTKDQTLDSLGEGILGDLALRIFKDNYQSLYLILDSLGVEGPSPWLTRDVHFVK
jgi:hypothetical protein